MKQDSINREQLTNMWADTFVSLSPHVAVKTQNPKSLGETLFNQTSVKRRGTGSVFSDVFTSATVYVVNRKKQQFSLTTTGTTVSAFRVVFNYLKRICIVPSLSVITSPLSTKFASNSIETRRKFSARGTKTIIKTFSPVLMNSGKSLKSLFFCVTF